jgi:hypothetical protein
VEGRLLLPFQILIRFSLVFLLVGVVVSLPPVTYAQSSAGGQCFFVGTRKTDVVGRDAPTPDGKQDVVFSLMFTPSQSAPDIAEIQIQAAKPSGIWSTRRTTGRGFIGVCDARDPSNLLNPLGGRLNISPNEHGNLLLFITDDGTFSDERRTYQVKVLNVNGTSWNAPVGLEPKIAPTTSQTRAGVYPVRMSALLKGISNYDAVNPGRLIRGDDKPDGLFLLTVEARDKSVTAIEIRNIDGAKSVWDTVPNSANGAIGVALASNPVRLLNGRDGSVRIPVKDRVDLNLYVADDGSIAEGKTHYRVAVTFEDGEISWTPVQRVREDSEEVPARRSIPERPRVNFLGRWLGYVPTDAVGPYPEMNPDGKADAVFGLEIEVSPKNVISGIELQSLDGISKRWGTGGTTPGSWGMGVAYQTSPKALINRPDGSVRIPADERSRFYLYVADPGDLSTTNQALRLIVHFADGTSYQQYVQRPAATTPTVVPGAEETPKAKGIITCEFRGFIADLVNTSTRPRKDGYLDGTFIMKLQVENKKLAKVEIKANDEVVRWSSDPRPPVMFLGVALYPKIYVLINPTGGMMNVPISGRRTLYLYGADNGLLSDPNSRLIATVTFSDVSTLSAEVIK